MGTDDTEFGFRHTVLQPLARGIAAEHAGFGVCDRPGLW